MCIKIWVELFLEIIGEGVCLVNVIFKILRNLVFLICFYNWFIFGIYNFLLVII